MVDGFEEMGTFTTIYNYPYYSLHLEEHGYVKDVDWLEYELEIPHEMPVVIEKASQEALRRFNLRVLETKNLKIFFHMSKVFFSFLIMLTVIYTG